MATVDKYQTSRGVTKYRVRYRTPDGRQTDKRGFTTKRDADAFAASVEVAKLKGEYVSPSLGRITIGELGPEWLERQRGIRKPSTFRNYEDCWRVHVLPRWGSAPIGKIRTTNVQAWVSELSTRLGAARVAETFGVFARILDDAVSDKMLAFNPARGVKLKERPPRRNIYLTAAQLHMLAEEAHRTRSRSYKSLVLLLGIGGLRWGEAVALRVCDVDFLRRRVYLERNAVRVGDQMIVGTLKNNENRIVVLPSFVIDAISQTAEGKGRDDLLWPGRDGGFLSSPNAHDSWLSHAVERCQKADPKFPRVTAHHLRHTAASLAVQSGAHVKVVQRMLGHKSAAMTLDVYADLFEEDLDSVAESVGQMWEREV